MMFRHRFISFILLLGIAPLGCHISNKGEDMLVRKLDAVMLTANDLPPTMELDVSSSFAIAGKRKFPDCRWIFTILKEHAPRRRYFCELLVAWERRRGENRRGRVDGHARLCGDLSTRTQARRCYRGCYLAH